MRSSSAPRWCACIASTKPPINEYISTRPFAFCRNSASHNRSIALTSFPLAEKMSLSSALSTRRKRASERFNSSMCVERCGSRRIATTREDDEPDDGSDDEPTTAYSPVRTAASNCVAAPALGSDESDYELAGSHEFSTSEDDE